ncbi:quinone oxidoreductase [Scheffersomyces amazonensis]|uniref:quinone oxidoreductase n=1 Tax=Scheffersomyces amazonensis TaxID=1078765 RepID=UPI00315C9444
MSNLIKSTRIVLKNAVVGGLTLEFNQPDSTFAIESVELDPRNLQPDEILVKTLYLSNDPMQRGFIDKGAIPSSHLPAVKEGDIVVSLALVEVVATGTTKYKVGDILHGMFAWADYAISKESVVYNAIDPSFGVPLPFHLSLLGMTSVTAYFGLVGAGKLKVPATDSTEKGLTVAISAASGATGSIAVQLSKHVFGASKVIAVTGSDEKVKWVKSIGADFAVSYNDPDYQQKLSDYIGEDFIDLYFDIAGGEILSYFLTKVKRFGHVVACGAIAGHNDPQKGKVGNWADVIRNSLTITGFNLSTYADRYPEGIAALVAAIKSNKISVDGFHVEDISNKENKLELVPGIWNQLFGSTKPNGKLITKLS